MIKTEYQHFPVNVESVKITRWAGPFIERNGTSFPQIGKEILPADHQYGAYEIIISNLSGAIVTILAATYKIRSNLLNNLLVRVQYIEDKIIKYLLTTVITRLVLYLVVIHGYLNLNWQPTEKPRLANHRLLHPTEADRPMCSKQVLPRFLNV